MSETRELTAEERAVVERFEAGEAAPESWPGYEATEWRCETCAEAARPGQELRARVEALADEWTRSDHSPGIQRLGAALRAALEDPR